MATSKSEIMTTETKKRTTKRRGNGEGTLYQRPDGRWVGTVTIGRDAVGKLLRRTVYGKTKGEANEKMIRLQSNKLDGTLASSLKTTVAAFLTTWLDNTARPTIRATTHANYKRAIDLHISPVIGGITLAKLGPAHIQGLYAEMERNGVGVHTRLLAHAVLHRAFKTAVKWHLLPRNVCEAVDPPRAAHSDISPLDAEQAGKLLEAAKGDRQEAIYILAIHGGLRLGELFGLQWQDIDLDGGAVTIRHTLSELNGMLTLSEPKTAKSRHASSCQPGRWPRCTIIASEPWLRGTRQAPGSSATRWGARFADHTSIGRTSSHC